MPTTASDPTSRHPAGAALVIGAAAVCSVPWEVLPGAEWGARVVRPEAALAAGMVLGLFGLTAFEKQCRSASRFLIQLIVALVGLRIDLASVARLGTTGLLLGMAVIGGAFVFGGALARLLRAGREPGLLLCAGTAICGGSAIAAVGSGIRASGPSMAVALGCVFILNAAALYLTPAIGDGLGMSSPEFGTWAGLAIHDYSSVLAAARSWDAAHEGVAASDAAEQAATVTKATRVIWIAPVAVLAAWWWRRTDRAGPEPSGAGERRLVWPIPWFLVAFIVASASRAVLPEQVVGESGAVLFRRADLEHVVKVVTGVMMTLALFLIGTGLTIATLRAVGWRALAMAMTLWLIIGSGSLLAVRAIW